MTLRRAHVVRHVAFEDLGILEPVLRERGVEVAYLESGVHPLPEGLDGEEELLVVLGGPIGVGDVERYPSITAELELIRRAIDGGVPVLGICLGAQLIAAALGAQVSRGSVEIGFAPLELTDAGRRASLGAVGDAPVLHWHGDTFDLPPGAELLASTASTHNQAFAIGERVLALQFHVEADPARLEQWLIGHSHELLAHGLDPRDLRRDAAALAPELADRGREVLRGWLDGIRA